MSNATKKVVESTNPMPAMKGRFNLYHTPDGGYLIAYQKDPTDEEPEPEIQRMTIPGQVVRAAQMMSEGKMNPMQAFKMFAGMMGNG